MNVALEIAKKSILANQFALTTVANNISNANNEEYSRQKAILVTGNPILYPQVNKIIASGIAVQNVERVKNEFYDTIYRDNNHLVGYNEYMFKGLEDIENAFLEPTDNGVKTAFDNFWKSMQELTKNPENKGIREGVRQNAIALVNTLKYIYKSISQTKLQYLQQAEIKVNEINQILKDIKVINDEIGRLNATGQNPINLMDKRDALLDKLSRITNINVINLNNNMINVVINGYLALQPGRVSQLQYEITNTGIEVMWEDGNKFKYKSGELGAVLELVNNKIDYYKDKLNTLTSDYIKAFNEQHMKGFTYYGTTNIPFFKGNDATDIDISDEIKDDVYNIAASLNGEFGDNTNALLLSEINSKNIIDNNKTSPLEFFDGIIVRLSIDAKDSNRNFENMKYVTNEIDITRKSISGVSLDEEISNMVNFQNAYVAATKVIKSVNEMLDSLLNVF